MVRITESNGYESGWCPVGFASWAEDVGIHVAFFDGEEFGAGGVGFGG